uniref:ETS domain-containing protein n=1 Tax=Glossina austeni TaxID=7395 RepID=A0A1A9ULY8_GLOAU
MSQTSCLTLPVASIPKVPFKFEPNNFGGLINTTSNDSYSTFTDTFDLSLLPQENNKDSSNSQFVDIPTTVYDFKESCIPVTQADIKLEQVWSPSTVLDGINHEKNYRNYFPTNIEQKQIALPKLKLQSSPLPPLSGAAYPSPQSSPAQTEYNSPHYTSNVTGHYDPANLPNLTVTNSPYRLVDPSTVKQDQLHILPPSPPESNCCGTPSPQSYAHNNVIKSEPFDSDVETFIDLNSMLQEQTNPTNNDENNNNNNINNNNSCVSSIQHPQQQDYQLLREYLEDTTFQKKHNLKPLALDSFATCLEEVRGDIEGVISLALEHVKCEAEATCARLQISQDPCAWSPSQVHAWLQATIQQFRLPSINNLESKFNEDGTALLMLSEEEFIKRVPECGSTLHAQLEIWKLAYSGEYNNERCTNSTMLSTTTTPTATSMSQTQQQQQQLWVSTPSYQMDTDEDIKEDNRNSTLPKENSRSISDVNNIYDGSIEETKGEALCAGGNVLKRSNARSGGSHIHLWQFLKELLAAPHINGTAIRWIDRSKGIFKIEDSVRVAKLWGKRKNRPAMNYDKLSRSIRQYYKKGIMKKTERSQRLVYHMIMAMEKGTLTTEDQGSLPHCYYAMSSHC